MAKKGFGTLVKLGATPIAEVLDVGGPSMSKATIDATHQKSEEGWKEYLAGLKDGGEVSFQIQFIPTDPTHDPSTGIISAYLSDDPEAFKIQFSDLTEWEFNAHVTAFNPSGPVEGKLGAAVTLKLTGPIDFGII